MVSQHACTRHVPGTAACYSRHACPCDACRAEGRRQAKLNAYRRATGTRTRVPAGPVREHVAMLLREGVGRAEIARLADVETVTLTRLLRGQTRELRRDRADRILTVQPPPPAQQRAGRIHSCGMTRRVEGLNAVGWSTGAILEAAGLAPGTYRNAKATGHCFAASRAAIAAVCTRLENSPPPLTPSTGKTLARAQRLGFPRLAAWDDGAGPHGIDNPKATPIGVRPARERVTTRAEDIAEAIETGATLADLEHRFGITWNTTERALARIGRPDLANRIRPVRYLARHNQHAAKHAA